MIEIPVEQGSGDWVMARLGIPTAGNAHKILTPATRKYSKQARGYAFRLVAEKLLNESLGTIDHLEWVARGKEMEPYAVRMFEATEGYETAPVGFLLTDDRRVGGTPDRRIKGEAAFLEVKCPAPWVQLEYLIDGFGADYMAQVQCQIHVGEAEWVGRYAFHPKMPPTLQKTYRDELYIHELKNALDQFCTELAEIEEKARSTGFFEERIVAGQLGIDELLSGVDDAL